MAKTTSKAIRTLEELRQCTTLLDTLQFKSTEDKKELKSNFIRIWSNSITMQVRELNEQTMKSSNTKLTYFNLFSRRSIAGRGAASPRSRAAHGGSSRLKPSTLASCGCFRPAPQVASRANAALQQTRLIEFTWHLNTEARKTKLIYSKRS